MNTRRFFTEAQSAQKYNKVFQPSQPNPFLIYPSAVNKKKKKKKKHGGHYENPTSSISIKDGNTTQHKDPR